MKNKIYILKKHEKQNEDKILTMLTFLPILMLLVGLVNLNTNHINMGRLGYYKGVCYVKFEKHYMSSIILEIWQ